jgi:hypothetical protein
VFLTTTKSFRMWWPGTATHCMRHFYKFRFKTCTSIHVPKAWRESRSAGWVGASQGVLPQDTHVIPPALLRWHAASEWRTFVISLSGSAHRACPSSAFSAGCYRDVITGRSSRPPFCAPGDTAGTPCSSNAHQKARESNRCFVIGIPYAEWILARRCAPRPPSSQWTGSLGVAR